LKLTSNALVTVVKAEQDCFKELFEAIKIMQRVPDRRTVCVESTVRHNEPVSVGGM